MLVTCKPANPAVLVVISIALMLALCSQATLAARANRGKGASTSRVSSSRLILENSIVEFVFDAEDGALRSVRQKASGSMIALPADAAAGVRVWLGTAENPDVAQAAVSSSPAQSSTYRVLQYDGGVAIELVWEDLIDKTGSPTGVSICQRCELDNNAEFLRVTTRVANRGDLLITGLFLGLEGITLGGEPSKNVLSVPDAGMGSQWNDPAKHFAKSPFVASMPPTAPSGLACAWLDISGPKAGLGVGYLNRSGMDTLGEVGFDEDGRARMGWRMFRYQGGWIFMDTINGPLQVYSLRPGEDFTTDNWFIGLHAGDWHRTARFYRQEYERAFKGDYLTWQDVSPAVKQADVIFADSAAWGVQSGPNNVHDLSKGVVRTRFLDMPDKVDKVIKSLGVAPANTLFVMLGQATHWGIYKLPDYFPVCQEAGGPEDFREMIRRLRKDIGVAGTHFYAHGAFNHPEADNYVREADTGWSANLYANYDHLGRIACLDCEQWWQLWKNKIIPGFAEAGASGIEFDEGFGHHFICSKPEHRHGSSSVSILTAQPRGALRIFRECRRAFGRDGYLESEGGSDIGARHFDLWEGGGKSRLEIIRYTHPDKLITVFAGDSEDVCRAFVFGLPVLRYLTSFDDAFAQAVRKFVAQRAEIRRVCAPGYPNGFRDADGLSITGDILAKVYADGRGVTVAYYSKNGGQATIEVDGAALGVGKLGRQKRIIKAQPGDLGFLVIDRAPAK